MEGLAISFSQEKGELLSGSLVGTGEECVEPRGAVDTRTERN